MSTGRNLFYLNLILEVTEDRIVFASFHQVHLVIAHDTLAGIKRCRIFFKILSIDNHEGGLHVYVRHRTLIQIDRMLLQLGIVLTIGFHPVLTVLEVMGRRRVMIKFHAGGKVSAVIVLGTAQLLIAQVLVIGDEAFGSTIRNQRAMLGNIDHGETVRNEMGLGGLVGH